MENLIEVYDALEELASTSSVLEKVSLLEDFLEEKLFLKTIKYALNPLMIYHVKELPFKHGPSINEDGDKRIFKYLKKLAKSSGTTDKEKKELANLTYHRSVFILVTRIIKKDLRCGVSAALVNRARPNTIETTPYMRCKTDMKKIVYPCDSQLKANAMFMNLIIPHDAQKIKFKTRAGQEIKQLKTLRHLIRKGVSVRHRKRIEKVSGNREIEETFVPKPQFCEQVYMGEIIVRKKGKLLSRQESNGIISSAIQGTADPKDLKDVVLRLWDNVPYDKWLEGQYKSAYLSRKYKTISFCNQFNDSVELIESFEVDDYDEVREHYNDARDRDEEGTVVKNYDGFWEDSKSGSWDQIKVKNESEGELIITEVYKGEKGSKYEDCLGGLTCISAEGKVKVNVGGGYSDKQRGYHPIRNKKGGVISVDKKKAKKMLKYWEKQKGKICSVIYEGVIEDKTDREYMSLYLPRFDCERPDRIDADTLKILIAKEKGE